VAAELTATRRALHAVAELVLAGPQYRAHGSIRLRVRPEGFSTVVGPDVRVVEACVVRDDVIVPIDGATPATIAKELGLTASSLSDVYHDGPGIGPDDVLAADPQQAAYLAACLAAGDAALARFAPDTARALWPEHFDVGVRVAEVNYGVSPGDAARPAPYAYVGPDAITDDPFWNAPFGAVLPLGDDPDAAVIVAFFERGRELARH
jgi:hypothetical protein